MRVELGTAFEYVVCDVPLPTENGFRESAWDLQLPLGTDTNHVRHFLSLFVHHDMLKLTASSLAQPLALLIGTVSLIGSARIAYETTDT